MPKHRAASPRRGNPVVGVVIPVGSRDPSGMKANQGLARALKVFRAAMAGRTLDRHQVAEMLGIQPAAADRIMRALRSMPGVSVERGVISCDARYRLESPSDVMVLAGAMALSLSRVFGGSAQATSMRRLLDRLMGSARRKIADVDRKFFFVERGGEVALESPNHPFDEICEGVRDSRWISFTYVHGTGSAETVWARPVTVLVYQHQLYVLALRQGAERPYPFRVVRISDVRLGEPFEYPKAAEYDPNRLFESTFGVFIANDAPVETVEVRLTGSWARYAREHRWHKTQSVRSDGEACVVSFRVRVCPEVESWVMSLGEHAEVLGPQSLRERVAHRLHDAAGRYPTGSA